MFRFQSVGEKVLKPEFDVLAKLSLDSKATVPWVSKPGVVPQ